MINKVGAICIGMLFLPTLGLAQAAFEGTWRPDPQTPGPNAKPDSLELSDGTYACTSCSPPYKIPADGQDHAIAGNPYFDTLSVSIVDTHTVRKTAKRGGQTVAATRDVVSVDGASRTSTQMVFGMMPKTVELTETYSRVARGPAKSHLLSGQWREIAMDLTNHDEDTTFKLNGMVLTMTDRMGRSFAATLDGADAPYRGDPDYTSVSLRLIDARTLEESDKKDGAVVKINRWSLDPDGKTIHARFDDTHGHVQEQTGHRIAP